MPEPAPTVTIALKMAKTKKGIPAGEGTGINERIKNRKERDKLKQQYHEVKSRAITPRRSRDGFGSNALMKTPDR